MFKIGEFSKLSQVPTKTLRYYDNIGLLEPEDVDRFTGYRYYTLAQLHRLNRILALKDLGFRLEQIAEILDDNPSSEQLRGMLRLQQEQVEQQIQDDRARLARIEARLRLIEQEGTMPEYETIIKSIESFRAATLHDIAPTYQEMGPLWGELMGTLQQAGVTPKGPALAIYYDEEYKASDVDVEVVVPIGDADFNGAGRVTVREIPAYEHVASLMFQGPYIDFTPAYQTLMTWIKENGYQVVDSNREIYLRGPSDGIDPEEYLTEIQFPVKPV